MKRKAILEVVLEPAWHEQDGMKDCYPCGSPQVTWLFYWVGARSVLVVRWSGEKGAGINVVHLSEWK